MVWLNILKAIIAKAILGPNLLLSFSLKELRFKGVDVAMTYGNPNYYSKTGLRQINEDVAKAPLKLSYPEGWLAQSLTESDFKPLLGACRCVEALNKPEQW